MISRSWTRAQRPALPDPQKPKNALAIRPGNFQLSSCQGLRICLVTIRAFQRSSLAILVFRLMAINAESCGCCGVVECGLQLDGNRWSGGVGMAVGASLLRSLQRFLRLGRVMANFTFASHLQVCSVVELHRAYRSAFQNDWGRRSCLRECTATYQRKDQKSQ